MLEDCFNFIELSWQACLLGFENLYYLIRVIFFWKAFV